MSLSRTVLILVACCLGPIAILRAGPASATESSRESRLAPIGIRSHVGVVIPDKADAGLLAGGTLELGSVWKPWIRLSTGATRWSADLDPDSYGGREGRLTDWRIFSNLGFEFFQMAGVRGYVNLGIGTHLLDAVIEEDPQLADAVSGTNIGGEMAYGLVSTRGRLRISGEVRRAVVDDASNWSFVVGLGTRWGSPYRTVTPVVPAAPAMTSTPAEPENRSTTETEALAAALAENRTLRERVDQLAEEFSEYRESATRAEMAALKSENEALQQELVAARLDSPIEAGLPAMPNGVLLSIGEDLLFASGAKRISPAGVQELDRLAEVIRRFPGSSVVVEGHTDDQGDASANLVLSLERAETVRAHLVRAGLPASEVQAVGYGQENPVADNQTPEGRARNRRVDVRIHTAASVVVPR